MFRTFGADLRIAPGHNYSALRSTLVYNLCMLEQVRLEASSAELGGRNFKLGCGPIKPIECTDLLSIKSLEADFAC